MNEHDLERLKTKSIDEADPEELISAFLNKLGFDVTREGLCETPKRYTKVLKQFSKKDDFHFTTFDAECDQMVVQKSIPFYSLCEHHMLPFFGTANVGYIPKDRIVGLSKLARAVDYEARTLQNQERITNNTADFLFNELDAKGVAVCITARHLCMEMRGVEKWGSITRTTALKGKFLSDPEVKKEFLNQIDDKV